MGCDAATIACSMTAGSYWSGPFREPYLGSARRDRQPVPDTTIRLDTVSRPNQRPAQLANVLAESRGGDYLDQEAAAHRGPARGVEHLEKRPPGPGEHPRLAPRDEFAAPPIHIRFCIKRVC